MGVLRCLSCPVIRCFIFDNRILFAVIFSICRPTVHCSVFDPTLGDQSGYGAEHKWWLLWMNCGPHPPPRPPPPQPTPLRYNYGPPRLGQDIYTHYIIFKMVSRKPDRCMCYNTLQCINCDYLTSAVPWQQLMTSLTQICSSSSRPPTCQGHPWWD